MVVTNKTISRVSYFKLLFLHQSAISTKHITNNLSFLYLKYH